MDEKIEPEVLSYSTELAWKPRDYEPLEIRLVDAIAYLQERLAEIPPQSRADARFRVELSGDYVHSEFTVNWSRLETEDELKARSVNLEKANEVARKAWIESFKLAEKRERAEYERLKAKYAPSHSP